MTGPARRADRRHRLHRPPSAARSCRSAAIAIRVLLRRPTDAAAGGDRRRRRRPRPAAEHGGGAARRRCGDPLGRHRARHVGRAARTTTGPSTPRRRSALARAAERAGAKRFVFLSSIRAQSGPDRGGRADRGAGAARRPTPTGAPSSTPSRAWPTSASTGSRCARCWSTAPGVKGNMAALVRLARSPWPLPLGGLHGAALAAVGRQPRRGHRRGAAAPSAAAAPAHRRRPGAADRRGHDRRPARGASAAGRALSRSPAALMRSCVRGRLGDESRPSRGWRLARGEPVGARGSCGWVPAAETRAGLAALARNPAPGALNSGIASSKHRARRPAGRSAATAVASASSHASTRARSAKIGLCGHDAVDADLGHRLLAGEQDLVQALARPRAGDLDLDVLAGLEAGKADHALGELVDAHRLAHLEDVDRGALVVTGAAAEPRPRHRRARRR